MRDVLRDDWFIWATSTDASVAGAPLSGTGNLGCQYYTLPRWECLELANQPFMAATNGGCWHVVKDLEPFLDWCVARGKLTREEADIPQSHWHDQNTRRCLMGERPVTTSIPCRSPVRSRAVFTEEP